MYNNNKIFALLMADTERGDDIDKMIADERLRRYSFLSLTADDKQYITKKIGQ